MFAKRGDKPRGSLRERFESLEFTDRQAVAAVAEASVDLGLDAVADCAY